MIKSYFLTGLLFLATSVFVFGQNWQPTIGGQWINGKVGIGTEKPSKKLQISGGADSEVAFRLGEHNATDFITSPTGSLTINSDVGGSDGRMFLNVRDLNHISLNGDGRVGIGITEPKKKFQISAGKSSKVTFRLGEYDVTDFTTAPNGSLTINSDVGGSDGRMFLNVRDLNHISLNGDGRVGIGITEPKKKFQISAGKSSKVTFRLGEYDVTDFTTAPNGSLTINSDVGGSDGKMFLNVRNLNHLCLDGDGNVGIGITNPTAKLHVDGNIIAEELKIQMVNAPDYVFQPDYTLKSIDEVESFVNENKHLPDVPSAKDFEENGVDQSKMNKLLLQKIEELTLYMIDANKRMEKLETENKEMKKLLNN